MKIISKILIDSQNKRKQITGSYVEGEHGKKPDAYCALGAIACERGMIQTVGDDASLSMMDILLPILGVTEEEYCNNIVYCPLRTTKLCESISCDSTRNLGGLIVHLNDEHQLTFRQIGLILNKLGY